MYFPLTFLFTYVLFHMKLGLKNYIFQIAGGLSGRKSSPLNFGVRRPPLQTAPQATPSSAVIYGKSFNNTKHIL